ncbi:hexosaminidase D-like isoform X2 [Myxocyprinus asiaticus]|nr:hexosaminidase D-like isoform X2 [Myxocyprinus asiaticus]XP_051572854.1 hexosaminidase D-like isoform X2 [Myxocyprinus asiaticus]XP_051572855.1 hexosaminidase D-like isoform X2 [Myxocyprinus asiaticus]XP_051572856.1 hexosaminidase D-like isoform X2 [Myxocyprinus asiaticus]XP_051572857.1 hexosaminidase D-like isoform X2 [Myxocyprinus asiaticus]
MNSHKFLRFIVGCLVIVATVKYFFSPSSSSGRVEKIIQGSGFWSQHRIPPLNLVDNQIDPLKKEQPQQPSTDRLEVHPKKPASVLSNQEELHLEVKQAPDDNTMAAPFKIVHLDLKGAAPKVKYLEQIFPLLSSLGANGILLEYEDMFPYEGELAILKSSFAYSPEDIEEIKSLAKRNQLELIPLVQVFGHLEFVLKHEKYFSLREVAEYPNSINSLAQGSLELVKEMLTQVMKKHPESKWFHIGADEVRGLGESEDSKRWLEANSGDMGKLFLNHVVAVGHFMTKMRPEIRLILWDDMFRKFSSNSIQESGLQRLASPMIWNYLPNMDVDEIGNLISKYEQAGFQGVWFASAFKGASGIDQRWTPIDQHLKNHLQWLKVIASMPQYKSISFSGIAVTGWQRYEHHTVLCELLPVAIPSLAVCLQTLKYGSFNNKARSELQHIVGCEIQLHKNDCKGKSFPGSDIYDMVKKINNNLESSIKKIMTSYHVRGSFSSYHRKRNFANPRNLGFFKDSLKKLLDEWDSFLLTFRQSMEAIYYPDTLEEWLEENVNEHIERLHEMVIDVERIIKLNGQPKMDQTS